MIRRFCLGPGLLALTAATVTFVVGCTKKATEKPRKLDVEPKNVRFETSMGNIVVELNEKAAPVTVSNFLRYVQEGFYDGTVFHRVIPNFMIQGGGFTTDMEEKQTHEPIVNEASNGLNNNRGTVAMARTNNPHSATSQFFINHKDNNRLNYIDNSRPGYAVFGRVVEGMDVVDAIANVETGVKTATARTKDGSTRKVPMRDVPMAPVVIRTGRVVPDR